MTGQPGDGQLPHLFAALDRHDQVARRLRERLLFTPSAATLEADVAMLHESAAVVERWYWRWQLDRARAT